MFQKVWVSFFLICFLSTTCAHRITAQVDSVWTLHRAVQFALAHNISLELSELNQRRAELALKQSRLSQIPSFNVHTGYGRSFGRSVDPTSNQFVQGSYDFMSASGQADVLLFGWFQKRNTIEANKLRLQAVDADQSQAQDDISLNVATGFLRALLAREQIRVNQKQVELSEAQLKQTRQFVEAGRLPELNAAQLEAQLAGDSATLIAALSDYNGAILDLKALLNLHFEAPFYLEAPPVEITDQIQVASLTPEQIFEKAKRHFGIIESRKFSLDAARRDLKAAKAARWPQLGLSAQFGTNYATTYTEVTGFQFQGLVPANGFVFTGTDTLRVYEPAVVPTTRRIPFGSQIENNFRQTITLGLTIPIFNSWQTQYNISLAHIDVVAGELNEQQALLDLKKEVYNAYQQALSAMQKYQAAIRARDAAQKAFNFAVQRYELGLTNTVEYLTTQNNQFVAESNWLSAKYDLIFKLKVIDYYLGQTLKL